jgi:hypothetical protein
MSRHFHLLLADRGERFGCLLFRKVANWYCKVLRPGRVIQQKMVRIASAADFASILGELRSRPPAGWDHCADFEDAIAVPKGPIEHW